LRLPLKDYEPFGNVPPNVKDWANYGKIAGLLDENGK